MNKKRFFIGISSLFVFSLLLTNNTAIQGVLPVFGDHHAQVDYPKGYRKWTHVKSLILQEGHPL